MLCHQAKQTLKCIETLQHNDIKTLYIKIQKRTQNLKIDCVKIRNQDLEDCLCHSNIQSSSLLYKQGNKLLYTVKIHDAITGLTERKPRLIFYKYLCNKIKI